MRQFIYQSPNLCAHVQLFGFNRIVFDFVDLATYVSRLLDSTFRPSVFFGPVPIVVVPISQFVFCFQWKKITKGSIGCRKRP